MKQSRIMMYDYNQMRNLAGCILLLYYLFIGIVLLFYAVYCPQPFSIKVNVEFLSIFINKAGKKDILHIAFVSSFRVTIYAYIYSNQATIAV